MRPKSLIAPAILVLLLLAGCQTWQSGGSRTTASNGTYSLEVPSGWMFHPTLAGGQLLATQDGSLLQRLFVEQLDLTKPLPHSKRTVSDKLSAFEVGETVVDDLRANHALLGLEIKENVPVNFGGQPGFKIHYTYHVADPANFQVAEVRYGAVHGGKLHFLVFTAPARHYFERDIGAATAAAQSFKFAK